VDISCGILARLAEKVIFAISTEQNSIHLNGALLKLDRSGLTMVATDGHRLALAASPIEITDLDKPIQVSMPKKAVLELPRFSENRNDQMVRCSFTDNHLFFAWSERLLVSRKGSGSFPDYQRVLPKHSDRSISLEREVLRNSIERVSRFSDSQTRCIVVDISPGQFVLQAQESNIGESEEVIPVAYEGDQVRIGFNSSYLSEFLARAEHRHIRLLFSDGRSAAELQPDAPEASGYRYVVMPMSIREGSAAKQ